MQALENKTYISEDILSIVQSRIARLSGNTAFKYRKTISEFAYFLTSHRICLENIRDTTITDWVVELLRQGLSLATITQRLNILNGLFKTISENGIMLPCHKPREIARNLESAEFALPPLLKASVFDKSLASLRNFTKDIHGHSLCGDILLFSVLNGAEPLRKIIYLTKEDLPSYGGHSRRILERNINGRRKFIFDLKQSYQTPRQIESSITDGLRQTFGYISTTGHFTFENLAGSFWAAFAMRCGSTASEASGCISNSAPFAIPHFCTASDNTQESRKAWLDAVGSLLTKELPKWYAMRLRKGVRFHEISKEIHDRIHPMPELFYPVETITKKRGNITTVIEQPFISQTVFFKSYPENVTPMFAMIGDKAWCLKVSAGSDAPYAVIPQADMQRFQRAIGVFSADADIQPLGTLAPRPGETVILIQAGYSSRAAEVESVSESDCGTAIIRVRLTTDYGYEWRATVDARQIERIIKAN